MEVLRTRYPRIKNAAQSTLRSPNLWKNNPRRVATARRWRIPKCMVIPSEYVVAVISRPSPKSLKLLLNRAFAQRRTQSRSKRTDPSQWSRKLGRKLSLLRSSLAKIIPATNEYGTSMPGLPMCTSV